MLPSDLIAADFAGFPPEARATVVAHLAVLQSLPLVLAPFILRELAGLDWKMPAERRTVLTQLRTLADASPARRSQLLASFRSVDLGSGSGSPIEIDWLHDPGGFIEQLTAWLWSSHQTEHFRQIADAFAEACAAANPAPPTPPRLGLVVLGQGTSTPATPLFARLRPFGVHLTHVDPSGGLAVLISAAKARATASASLGQPFTHWYIDGAHSAAPAVPGLTQVTYGALAPAREQLLARTDHAMGSGSMGPESLRSLLAHLRPADLGLPETPATIALSHFQLSILTEGSGTQIFATTFVQWAARECIRRAEPQTLLLRFTPRQQAQAMEAMLGGTPASGLDPAGSLVDADEAAWLTFVGFRRLPGAADTLRFLVWHEDQSQALVIGPGLPAGTSSSTPMDLHAVLKLLA
jgi:hypothetical protein